MDKKLQFQIQQNQAKLLTYNATLQNLLDSRSKLDQSLLTINPNRSRIIELQQTRTNLEKTIQTLKNTISITSNQISKYTQDLKLLPITRDTNLENEDTILKDEHYRIDIKKIEYSYIHKENTENAYLDKQQIYSDIDLIKNDLKQQNNIITDIQLNSHSSRKETLTQLHQKKQDKLSVQQQIKTFKENELQFTNQITSLEATINKLTNFKTIMVDNEYGGGSSNSGGSGGNSNSDASDTLDQLYTEFAFAIDKSLSLNDKIAKIDKLISESESRLLFINKRYTRNKEASTVRIKDILDTYNTTNRIKVLGYKDQFKIEKEKKQNLELILDDLTKKYNTFDDIILGNINEELANSIKELEFDKIRSLERLDIMKSRIIKDYEEECIKYNKLIDTNKEKMKELRAEFDNTMLELEKVNKTIEQEDIVGNEINKLDKEISKYQDIIKAVENDIKKISMV